MIEKKYSLLSDFQIRGYWWIPGNQERNVIGTLKFAYKDKIELVLDGSFWDRQQGQEIELQHPKIINGVTFEGEHCTVLEAIETKFQYQSVGIGASTLVANYVILGEIFSDFQDINFRSIQLGFTNLEAWMSRNAFPNIPISPALPVSASIQYVKPKNKRFSIPKLDASLRFESEFCLRSDMFSRKMTHTDFIRITPKKKQSFSWFRPIIFDLRNLLSLFTFEKILIHSIEAEVRKKKESRLGGKMISESVHFIFIQANAQVSTDLAPPDIPFRFAQIEKDLTNILGQWLGNSEKLRSVYDLFFGSFYNSALNTEFQFLSLIQALESLHRTTSRGKYVSKKQYEGYENTLLMALSSDMRSDLKMALKSRLKYGNEYSLRKRLQKMFDSLGSKARAAVTEKHRDFINEVVDTRNYLTHYDTSSKGATQNLKGMLDAIFKLRFLLTILLFKRIGLKETTILQVLNNHGKFKKPDFFFHGPETFRES